MPGRQPQTDLEFRQPNPDELHEFLQVSIRSYGSDATSEEAAHEVLSNEIDRSHGALDGATWVGSSGAYSVETTLPGGQQVGAAAISMIGVAPTHRRRGILTELMKRLHRDATQRNEAIAVLTASESTIYRRFGYGTITDVAHLSIAANTVRFDPPLDENGSFVLVDPHDDVTEMQALFETERTRRTGWLSLTAGMWEQIKADPEHFRRDKSPLRGVVHCDTTGTPDGYVTWRIHHESRSDRLAANTVHIEHLVGETPDVEAALWSFVANIDLATEVVWECGPPDPAIKWRLIEPRQLRTLAHTDMMWARLLDIPTALSRRTYAARGTLVIDVHDRFHPDCGGRFRITSKGRGWLGTCVRLDEADDEPCNLTLDTADLASLTFGTVNATTLAQAGRLTGTTNSIDLADALFTVPARPWWPIEF